VSVGCAPRLRLAGDRSSLGQAWTLWVDCDGDASVARLAQFAPAPAVVVRSGSATNVHAYWPLVRPLAPDRATAANRQLAEVLAADGRSADATRILRAPGTRNFKHDPPRAVVLERFKPARRFTVAEVVGTTAMGTSTPASAEATASVGGDDPLRRIPPGVYVAALTGQAGGCPATLRGVVMAQLGSGLGVETDAAGEPEPPTASGPRPCSRSSCRVGASWERPAPPAGAIPLGACRP
jgi:hypothetical protein